MESSDKWESRVLRQDVTEQTNERHRDKPLFFLGGKEPLTFSIQTEESTDQCPTIREDVLSLLDCNNI